MKYSWKVPGNQFVKKKTWSKITQDILAHLLLIIEHNSIKLELFVLITLITFYGYITFYNSIRNYSKDIKNSRVKGPRTPEAPDLTEYQKEVIFGTMLGD